MIMGCPDDKYYKCIPVKCRPRSLPQNPRDVSNALLKIMAVLLLKKVNDADRKKIIKREARASANEELDRHTASPSNGPPTLSIRGTGAVRALPPIMHLTSTEMEASREQLQQEQGSGSAGVARYAQLPQLNTTVPALQPSNEGSGTASRVAATLPTPVSSTGRQDSSVDVDATTTLHTPRNTAATAPNVLSNIRAGKARQEAAILSLPSPSGPAAVLSGSVAQTGSSNGLPACPELSKAQIRQKKKEILDAKIQQERAKAQEMSYQVQRGEMDLEELQK